MECVVDREKLAIPRKTIINRKHKSIDKTRVTGRPLATWYNEKLINAKQIRRQLERKERHASLQVHREMYKTHCAQVKSINKVAKYEYYASEIQQGGSDNKRLYNLQNERLPQRKSPCLPANHNMQYIAASFSNFFCAKNDTIRVYTQLHHDHIPISNILRVKTSITSG